MELALRPGMDEQDLCKLLYQAVLGCDHLLGDRRRFLEELRGEWAAQKSSICRFEPPLQLISPEMGIYRAHLATLRSSVSDGDRLLEILASQPLLGGSLRAYARLHRRALQLARQGAIPFDPERLELHKGNGAPVHHSASYGPCSYRVVNCQAVAEGIAELVRR